MNLVDCFTKEILLQHACWSRKRPQPTGALWATKIARGCWFERDRNRVSPLDGFFGPLAQVKAAQYFDTIPCPSKAKFGKKIQGIVSVKTGHNHKGTSNKPM